MPAAPLNWLPAGRPNAFKPVHKPIVELITPSSVKELEAAREIIDEYVGTLPDAVRELEMASGTALPGEFAQPQGILLLAIVDGAVAGCCGLRPLDLSDYPNACEMKRLYVRTAFRGFGLGRQLAEAVMDAARMSQYASIFLDTLDEMESARALYKDLGFREAPAYSHSPLTDAVYLQARL